MTGPAAQRLSGDRLHLQHGPIDLVIAAEGAREAAFAAATRRFETLLDELVSELPLLRCPVLPSPAGRPGGETARRMHAAAGRHTGFVTPMAAVAGAVADTILAAMTQAADLRRAHVNNGGDIAIHLAPGKAARAAIARAGRRPPRHSHDPRRRSGARHRHQRARRAQPVDGHRRQRHRSGGSAAEADVAATLIANAVDLPGHPAIRRAPARDLQPDSDLGRRLVVTGCGPLTATEIAKALENGAARAQEMTDNGLIQGAALVLQGQGRIAGVMAESRKDIACLT